MKIAPVSGDLLLKLGIGVAAVGVAVYTVKGAVAKLPDWPSPGDLAKSIGSNVARVADAINPLNPDNVFAEAADAATSAAAGYETNIGGEISDWVDRMLKPFTPLAPGETTGVEPTYDAMGNRTN